MAFKKTTIFVSFVTVSLFVGSVGVLLATPRVVNLVDSTLVLAQNESWKSPLYLQPVGKVAGIQKKPQVKIINNQIIPPKIYSRAAVAIDVETGKILYDKDSTQRLSPASTTKIMTALVSKDLFRPADVLTVTKQSLVGGSTMGLSLGETMSYRALLYGMMLNSGNDAAFTIAANYPDGGIAGFMAKVNEKVQELGLTDTHFQNPSGFDDVNHYSSAYDLAKIAREAVKDPTIAKVIGTKDTEVMSWDKTYRHDLTNLNKLLGQDGVIGVKTGTTDLSGESFVGLVERDGHRVITVVLNSPDRFGESKALIDWIYQNYEWKFE